MLFSSIPFLFYFLPPVLLLYFLTPDRWKNLTLLLSSLVFYGWGEPRFLLFMLASIAQGYAFGRLMERYPRHKRLFLALSAVLSLSLLGYCKYAGFFLRTLGALTGLSLPALQIALPIGISFYTFQVLSYVIDVYRGTVPPQRNLLQLATYVAMFPQLIAGPIVRYQDIAAELNTRTESLERFSLGIRRFVVGLGKKVLLANQAGALWTEITAILPADRSVLMVWMGILAFAFQIYFDFSGYSDMAVGMGHMLGFHFPENFNYPYISKSITEFWRRWHISLGTWFKEYVYIPLGGNRKGGLLQVRNILVVWLLTGIWHGASINFLLWGIYFGLLLLLEKFVLMKYLKKLPSLLQCTYAFLLVLLGWVLFAFEDMGQGFQYLLQMTGASGLSLCNERTIFLLSGNLVLLAACALGSTPLPARAAGRWKDRVPEPLFLGLVLLLSVAYLVNATYNPFLYFRF